MESSEKFELIVKTFKGLEEVLAGELQKIGAEDVQVARRAVVCQGTQETMYKANLHCRTALRVLKPILHFKANTADEVYEQVKALDWSPFLDTKMTFAVDAVVFSEDFRHSKFVAYRVKDAIVDHFSEKNGKRPNVSVQKPDLSINIHIASNNECTLSLNSSGESLHKRGYRLDQNEAPLSEVLAAGMLLMAGWDGQSDFYDPMCGSGTILIEAAMIALNIAPGIFRSEFGFERWKDFDADLLDNLYNDDSYERPFNYKVYGSDMSPSAIKITNENIKRAGLAKYIEVERKNFNELRPKGKSGLLITNPPYGERIKPRDIEDLYSMMGERFKHHWTGFNAWVLSFKKEFFYKIGLRPSQKLDLMNGPLDCHFYHYEMYEGSKKTSKNQGFHKEDFKRGEKRDFHRGSRDDFRSGERKEFRKGPRDDFKREEKREFRKGPRDDFKREEKREFRKGPREDFKRGEKREFRKESHDDFKGADRRRFRKELGDEFKRDIPEETSKGPKRVLRKRIKREKK